MEITSSAEKIHKKKHILKLMKHNETRFCSNGVFPMPLHCQILAYSRPTDWFYNIKHNIVMKSRDVTVHLKYSAAVAPGYSGTTHPSHSIHHIDMQRFIDISSLDGSPHTGRNPVLSKSATDGCIELFWSRFL